MNGPDYIDPSDVVALRIFSDHIIGHAEREWFLDGWDRRGGFTEQCWSFDSYQHAVDAMPDFWEALNWAVTEQREAQ